MNTKIKSLALAVALASSGAAQAAIDAPFDGGELFFNIWDPTVGKEFSFTMGLNTNVAAFMTAAMAPGTMSFGNIFSNATYSALFSDPADGGHDMTKLRWNVFGASSTGVEDDLVLVTQALNSNNPYNNGNVQGGVAAAANFLQQAPFNTAANEGGHSNPLSPVYAPNPLQFNAETIAGIFQPTTNGVGGDLGFYMYGNTGSYGSVDEANMQAFNGKWNLSSTGDLSYSVSAVPVPAAAWLLGSALVGLVGISRRRNSDKA